MSDTRRKNKGNSDRARRSTLRWSREERRKVDLTESEVLHDIMEWQGGDEPERVGVLDKTTGGIIGGELINDNDLRRGATSLHDYLGGTLIDRLGAGITYDEVDIAPAVRRERGCRRDQYA